MKIFLSYASQDRALAAAINRALLHQGHDVFFDRDDLPPGEEFHDRIRAGIERSKLFVFLASGHALDPASYTLSELEIAQKVIERPHGRLLPVLLEPMDFAKLPAFLKSVTVLETPGDITAAVADAVYRIAQKRKQRLRIRAAIGMSAITAIAAGIWLALPDGALPQERIGKDKAPADLVPAGTFAMGDGEFSPQRKIHLDAFYIDRFEVTTGRYAKFLAATGSVRAPQRWDALDLGAASELPVVGVDWNDAAAYCAWAGRRLPTEAEWEKAARGSDGRMYPWGNESPTLERANYLNASPDAYGGGLHKVGSHPAGRSPLGVHDMAGNANEWVADWYAEAFASGDVRNPRGAESGTARVIRGGGRYDSAERIASARRWHAPPSSRSDDIGFRCADDAR
jgi:formylglycine-generating enzyme required for sulfatase activity